MLLLWLPGNSHHLCSRVTAAACAVLGVQLPKWVEPNPMLALDLDHLLCWFLSPAHTQGLAQVPGICPAFLTDVLWQFAYKRATEECLVWARWGMWISRSTFVEGISRAYRARAGCRERQWHCGRQMRPQRCVTGRECALCPA